MNNIYIPLTFGCYTGYLFIYLNPHLWTSLLILGKEEGREGEKERERETDRHVRLKHGLVASYLYPNWGSNLKPKCVPCLGGNQTHSLLVHRMTLQPTESPGQDTWLFFNFVYNFLLTSHWPITTKSLSLLEFFYAKFFNKIDQLQVN